MTSPSISYPSDEHRNTDVIANDKDDDENGDRDDDDSHFCNILYDEHDSDVWLRVADFIVLFLVPMAIMLVLYIMMARKLWGKQVGRFDILNFHRFIFRYVFRSQVS